MRIFFYPLLFSFSSFGQDSGLEIDTTFYSNGSIETIVQVYIRKNGTRVPEGLFQFYDSTGVLIHEGYNRVANKIQCINCYEEVSKGDTSEWVKYDMAKYCPGSVRVGICKRHYDNGRLESIGAYSGIFHESSGVFWKKVEYGVNGESRIGSGWSAPENLKMASGYIIMI
ncbi:MAG: antitoxin component YwqK of YwqJK toxin-antitoxin module [Salibacteraceae bacterium]|jgi:antitoxin component YwqK of YwqJK toxin-antitoxin module